jgi:PAS domain S-box
MKVESEPRDRYRRLVELSPDGILISQDNRLVFLNPAALRLFGASAPEQVLGKSPFDVFHPESHALIRERIRPDDGSASPCRRPKKRSCGWTAA